MKVSEEMVNDAFREAKDAVSKSSKDLASKRQTLKVLDACKGMLIEIVYRD